MYTDTSVSFCLTRDRETHPADIMRISSEMKTLAVVGVLLVVVGVSDSLILTKCGLKKQLEAAELVLPPGVMNQNSADLLAKLVCHVQLTSGFNTSAVKQITNPKNSSREGVRKGRSPGGGKGRRPSASTIKPSSSGEGSSSGEMHNGGGMKLWTLYGLFQLSDSVACNSTAIPSLNVCGMSCSKLIDDDISDDMACVQVLIKKISTIFPDNVAVLINKMISLIYQTDCVNVVASSYFSDC